MLSLSTTEKVTVVFYVCSRLSETAVVVAGYQYLYTYVDEHLTCLNDEVILKGHDSTTEHSYLRVYFQQCKEFTLVDDWPVMCKSQSGFDEWIKDKFIVT